MQRDGNVNVPRVPIPIVPLEFATSDEKGTRRDSSQVNSEKRAKGYKKKLFHKLLRNSVLERSFRRPRPNAVELCSGQTMKTLNVDLLHNILLNSTHKNLEDLER